MPQKMDVPQATAFIWHAPPRTHELGWYHPTQGRVLIDATAFFLLDLSRNMLVCTLRCVTATRYCRPSGLVLYVDIL